MQQWDYRWAGAYFNTICTKNREHYFGEIANGKMELSPIGVIADILWFEIKNRAKNVELGAFVMMPNHMHGVLILHGGDGVHGGVDSVDSGHALNLQGQPSLVGKPQIGKNRFQNIGKNSVSTIVGSYKSAVTKHARRLGYDFAWQTLFYDHIIRNDKAFNNIQTYIIENPLRWKEDRFH